MHKEYPQMKTTKWTLLSLTVFALTSCSFSITFNGSNSNSTSHTDAENSSESLPDSSGDSSSGENISSPETGNDSASSPTDIKPQQGYHLGDDLTPYTLKEMNFNSGYDLVDSKADVHLMVIPIEFTDYKFSASTLTDIKTGIDGTAADTGYWESLASFYEKSSFGNLNITCEVTDIYNTGISAKSLYNTASKKYGEEYNYIYTADLVTQAVNSLADSAYRKKFDADQNGYIDGIIAIYSCPDVYSSDLIYSFDNTDFYWAYCYMTDESLNKSKPAPMNYFWMSYAFFSEAVSSPKVDSHTLIHEFGHMLGLDDYYSENGKSNPAGGDIMEDQNIKDHDVYSKLSLGWVTPYVVDDSCTITIHPSQDNGECILVPTSKFNNSVYDEYMLLELYTPTGLNKLDSKTAYPSRNKGITTSGVKLWHVDSRVAEITAFDENGMATSWNYFDGTTLRGNNDYQIAATNCQKNFALGNTAFNLLSLIDATNVNRFHNATNNFANNNTLFKTGDSFNLSTYGKNFFPLQTTMNNGGTLPYNIYFESVSAQEATIRFEKI